MPTCSGAVFYAASVIGMENPCKRMVMGTRDTHSLVCGRDRLSSLPEPIIHRIFSFLGANETARLRLLSRRFRQLCIYSPYLYFCAGLDSDWCSTRYSEFCTCVDALLRMREGLGIRLECFLVHWFCWQRQYNIGETVVNAWVHIATRCDVQELDILFCVDNWRGYLLPDCVYNCQSLRALRLNLQKGNFFLQSRKLDSLEDLWLDSLTIMDLYFGQKISVWWTSLKRLNLDKIQQINDLEISSSSLQEMNISNCEVDWVLGGWHLTISSPSFKVLTISRCYFKGRCKINLACPSLENFSVLDSDFEQPAAFNIECASLENLVVCGSNFRAACHLCISCPSVKQVKISNCAFEQFCQLNTNCLSLEDLTVSDCKLSPQKSFLQEAPQKCIVVEAKRLQTLSINSSDAYSYEFPLSISAPILQAIRWTGNPVDFSYLERFMSIVNATIDIKPACQHKSKKFACHCKLFKSLTCCAAMLLQSLSHAKFLKINIWLIEVLPFPILFFSLF